MVNLKRITVVFSVLVVFVSLFLRSTNRAAETGGGDGNEAVEGRDEMLESR